MNGNFIITGCSQGFGREFALRIARSGGRVVIADANVHKGEVIAKEMENCLFVECDVTDPEDWDELWDEATKFFDERGVQVRYSKCFMKIQSFYSISEYSNNPINYWSFKLYFSYQILLFNWL